MEHINAKVSRTVRRGHIVECGNQRIHFSVAAQERHGEKDERHPEGHLTPEEDALDATRHPTAPVAEKGRDRQIAQKQFRKRDLLSELPT